jgi:hypothetical protein
MTTRIPYAELTRNMPKVVLEIMTLETLISLVI